MIWKTKPTCQQLTDACRDTLCERMGMEFTEIGDDYLIASLPVDERTKQPAGLLHGGASAALAESLGSIASTLLVDPESMPVGVELNANHLKAVRDGKVYGKVLPIRCGRTLHVWSIEIRNERGDLVCVSRLTVMIVPSRKKDLSA